LVLTATQLGVLKKLRFVRTRDSERERNDGSDMCGIGDIFANRIRSHNAPGT
jgi:hypothetical protein